MATGTSLQKVGPTLEALISRRAELQRALEAKQIPAWRREDLWVVPDIVPELLEPDADFMYRFDNEALPQIVLHESHEAVGARVWDGAVLLGKYLEKEAAVSGGLFVATPTPPATGGRIIVEIGAGTGLVGLVLSSLLNKCAAASGGREGLLQYDSTVIMTDMPALLPRIQSGIDRNALRDGGRTKREAMPLVWGNAEHAERLLTAHGRGACLAPGDVIVASDLAAPLSAASALLCTLQTLMPPTTALDSVAGTILSPTSPPPYLSAAADTAATSLSSVFASIAPHVPVMLLCCQLHRDFTEPLISGCSERYTVCRVPPAELHPHFVSEKHAVFLIHPHWRH